MRPSTQGGKLEGKVALITGTGGGQGRHAAVRFAREGARIVGCDLNEAGARETAELVAAAGGEMISVDPVDLSDESQMRSVMDAAEAAYGGIDILYNNASALRIGRADEMSLDDFEFTMRNEVTVVWLAIKHAVPLFRARGGGVILNIGSIAGIIGDAFANNARGMFAHCVTKGAVIRMTSALAVELAPSAIRVNCISPGIIDTPATAGVLASEQVTDEYLSSLLVRRIGTPDDVVNAALFLASDDASYITGVNVAVDGGWAASGGAGWPSERTEDAIAAAFIQQFAS